MTNKDIKIVKRDGSEEKFNAKKIERMLLWAAEGIEGVDVETIKSNFEFSYTANGISSKQVHEGLIDCVVNLISVESPNYQIVAGRLLNYSLRKEVWGGKNPPRLLDLIRENTKNGVYCEQILKKYTCKEINKINEFIKHERDLSFTHGGIQQLISKYLVQDRKSGTIYETPQFAYALVAMTLFSCEEKTNRVAWVKKAYDYFSTFKINLATPVIAGARTPLRSFASCGLFDIDDSLDSIGAHDYLLKKASASRYGLGLNVSRIRPAGAKIRHGDVLHTGLLPFLKNFESGIKSCHQNGIRGASGTVYINWWHQQVEDVLVLKDNALPDEKAVRFLDYCLVFSKLFRDRIKSNSEITLFNPHEVPELLENFGLKGWDEMYLLRERDETVSKTKISARSLAGLFAKQRLETSRIYAMDIDNANNHGPFKEAVQQSNLCVAGDQRVPSNFGVKTAKELFEIGKDLVLFDGKKMVKSSPMRLVEKNVDIYEVELENGLTHKITGYHEVVKRRERIRPTNDDVVKVKCEDLIVGDKILFQKKEGVFGPKSMEDEAFLLGLYQADGTQFLNRKGKIVCSICLWENDFDLTEEVKHRFDNVYYKYNFKSTLGSNQTGAKFKTTKTIPDFVKSHTGHSTVAKKCISSSYFNERLGFQKGFVPDWIWEADKKTLWQYIRGLFYADGTANMGSSKGSPLYLSITNTNKDFIKNIQIILLNLGVHFSIHLAHEGGFNSLPNGKGGNSDYFCKTSYRLVCSSKNDALIFEENTGFLSRKGQNLEKRDYRDNSKKFSKVKSITHLGKEDVYCCTVDSDEHLWVCNGFVTSNCVEVTHPLKPSQKWNDPDALIGVCILSAVNLEYTKEDELGDVCEVIVRMLDNLIEYQSYFDLAAESFAKKYRSLGVGALGFATYMARNGVGYENENAPNVAARIAEKIEYNLVKASVNLAKERGPLEYYEKTKWADGELPIDRYSKNIDEFVTEPLHEDWEGLRADLKEFGIRNSTLTAYMPVESSSGISNSTSGLEPARDHMVVKESRKGNIISILPDLDEHKEHYTLAFDMKSNLPLLRVYAAINKFTDMSISANTYVNVNHYENKQIPFSVILESVMRFFEWGGKTLYYNNVEDGSGAEIVEQGCTGGACTL